MRKSEKIEEIVKLSTAVIRKLSEEQQQFLVKHNYQGFSNCVILNPTQADRKMMDEIAAKMKIIFICLVEPPDDPDEIEKLRIK